MAYTSKYAQDAMDKVTKGGGSNKKRTVTKGTVGEGRGTFKNVTRKSGTEVSKYKGKDGKAKRKTKPDGSFKEVTKSKNGKRIVTKGKR